jgi:threonine/homoserine/homoserine lactone efflux protein
VELGSWLTVAAVCATGAASPGPSLAVVVKNTVGGGRRLGVLTGLGHGLGVGIYAFLAVAGISTLVSTTPGLSRGIEIVGAAFLLWMAVALLRAASAPSVPGPLMVPDAPLTSQSQKDRTGFAEGFLVAFLNPKIAIFFLALLGSFLPEDAGTTERAGVALLAMGIDAGWYVFAALLLAGSGAAEALARNRILVDRSLAILLVVVAVFLLFTPGMSR